MVSTQSPLVNLPCFLVNNLTNNSLEQCKFIIENDCLEDESVIDYVYLVYCEFGQELRHASVILIVLLVIVLFLALSSVADEFLCPSLLAVAKNLRMSDSLAGVTLLAFGNGCPDIFSSLAAASDDRSELIVGELLGAGIFCTSIVSGLIFIHSDFKLACRPILRDTTFYLLAVYLIWLNCHSEQITFYGSLAFIFIYVIYLVVALSGQAIHSRLQGNYAITTAEESAIVEKYYKENWLHHKQESIKRKDRRKKSCETCSLSSSFKDQNHQTNHVTTIHLGADTPAITNTNHTSPLELKIYQSDKLKSTEANCYLNKAFVHTENKAPHDKLDLSLDDDLSSPQQVNLNLHSNKKKCNDLTPREWDDFLAHINPIDSGNWYNLRFLNKVAAIVKTPLLFVALVTIPVVDYDRKHNNWCRLLNSLHCITVPLTLILTTQLLLRENLILFSMPLPILALVPGVLTAGLVLKSSEAHRAPKYQPLFAYIGFAMSIYWIYMLAKEIISLLKTVGIIFSLSDTAIGLGVLAWGNSLGDIVANISLAEAGYPRMALGASIGAPLLNLLLGFGLSFTLNLKPDQVATVQYSPMITLLCSTLAIILVILMLSTLTSSERSKKPLGYLLIGFYGLYFVIAVCLEYGIIKT